MGFRQARLGFRTRSWLRVEGQIRSNEYEGSDNLHPLLKLATLSPLSAPSHDVAIVYDYLHVGKWWRGTTLYIGKRSEGKRAKILVYMKSFPVGARIPVYVNPLNPKESVLIPGVSLQFVQLLLLGVVMTGIGGYLGWIMLRASGVI